MLLRCTDGYFNPAHVARVRVVKERLQPNSYQVFLIGSTPVDIIAGTDEAKEFEAWIAAESAGDKSAKLKPSAAVG